MSTNGEAPSRIVVVGASAGGIDALGAFLKGLPDDFSAAVVVAQHLDPHRESHLVDILSRRTTLQVRSVARSVRLEAGIVYLAPPDADVEVSRTRVRKMESPGGRSQPSVDRLLASAAKAFEENAIAVILSGSGSDGAFGARTVKAAGGVVLVQDAESAAFAEMPTSLAPTTVDVVATAPITYRLPHSAKKKKRKRIPLYSVTYPATSSDSASGISKGVRLPSAKAAVK